MIFDSDGSTTVVFQEKATLKTFLENLTTGYDKIKNDHIIINLFFIKINTILFKIIMNKFIKIFSN